MTDNYFIADQFSLLSKLMDIHGENSFKTKSYSIAAFNIEKLPVQLAETDRDKIFSIKGIGENIGKKILEILDTGELPALRAIIQKTPPGIIEMLQIKGIGPKKISTIWKEMEIESIGELLYACNENRLLLYKGFGEKTQKNIADTIEFYLKSQGSFLYAEIEKMALNLEEQIKQQFPQAKTSLTGTFRQQQVIIHLLELVTTINRSALKTFVEEGLQLKEIESSDDFISFKGKENIVLKFYFASDQNFYSRLFETSSQPEFLEAWKKQYPGPEPEFIHEQAIFDAANIPFIPAWLRESDSILQKEHHDKIHHVIQPSDIKGIIHNHSNWSDGLKTIEEMAAACIAKGYEYLVISDHSKSAFYANGLSEERIAQQHLYVDELNKKLAPFRIYKSIESDILNDGSLDYDEDVLASFDLVIASVHSNLKMTEEKAMMRLINAIENPYTTILGHMTGRLLLSRNGYPVDHIKIVDACAANQVVIELNAHPRRLDIDWKYIGYALEKGVLISIDPDAHSIEGFDDVRYGVLAAQKALVTPKDNLSSFSKMEFEDFLGEQRRLKL